MVRVSWGADEKTYTNKIYSDNPYKQEIPVNRTLKTADEFKASFFELQQLLYDF